MANNKRWARRCRRGWPCGTLMLALGVGPVACHRPKPPPPRPGAAHAAADAPRPAAPPADERWLTAAQVASLQLRTEVAHAGELPAPITISGRITFDDMRVAHVVPPVNGYVTHVLVHQGKHVRRGDALACIDSPQLGQVVADVETSHADLLAAERDLARTQALFADQAVAKKQLEAAERRASEARAEYRRMREKNALLGGTQGEASDTYVVRAPIEGNVIVRNATVGSNVQGQYENGPSAPELFTLGSLDSVWAVADLFEMDVAHVRAGDPVQVSVVAYPEERFAGTVDWVAPNVDPDTRATRLRCRLDNARRLLRPEMFVTMVVGGRGQAGVLVPRSAVAYLGGKYVVFVALPTPSDDGRHRFVRREVQLASELGGTCVALVAGVARGETVVSRGGLLLSEMP